MRIVAIFACLALTNCATGAATRMGAVNPDVTQATIAQTICKRGWTKTIRPPVEYTNELKVKQMKERGLRGSTRNYEEDHFIPLALGGHPSDPNNLWPQPWKGKCSAHAKDEDENIYYQKVCNREMQLDAARKAIASKWSSCAR